MAWQPGQSGNPGGRKPKGRALAELLVEAGAERIDVAKGKSVVRKELLATLVWEGATTGSVKLAGRRTLKLSTTEWLELVKFIHVHVDGPKSAVDVTSGGEAVQVIGINVTPPTPPAESDEA